MSDLLPQAEKNGLETAVPTEADRPHESEGSIGTTAVNDTAVDAPPRRTARLVGMALIIFSVVLAWLLMVGFFAYQSGQRQLASQQEADLLSNLERQTALAAENINQGSYDLALRRLEWVLAREPNNRDALRLQSEANQALAAQKPPDAPQATATPPEPTAVPEPSPTPGGISSPQDELQRLRRLSVGKEWSDVVTGLIAFQQQFPSYEREETDRLLFDAYLGYGQILLEGNQPELGLYYLVQAEKLGSLPQVMLDYQTWAELYTQGISYYGVNWDAAAYYFRDLCLAAPFYGDACTKLHNILVAHGDQFANMSEWCPAQLLYEEAARTNNGGELAGKLEMARAGCLSATPTPSGPISDTLPITSTQPITASQFTIPAPTR